MKKRRIWALLLVPGLALIVLFLVVPILRVILPSFAPEGRLSLSLYKDFLTDSFYLGILGRTVRVSLITCLICIVLGLPVSYYISRMQAGRKGVMIALATFPLLTNTVVRAFAWIVILGQEGIINKLMMSVGLISEPLRMLFTEGAIVVGSVYLFLPIMLTSLVSVMENIGEEVQEAALSLGANRFVSFMRIVVPLSMPGIIVGSVLVFTGTASAYSTPLMLGGNRNMMLSTLVYQQAMLLNNWDAASVISALMIVISYAVVGVLNGLSSKINKTEVTQ